jgi:hypothetical protein
MKAGNPPRQPIREKYTEMGSVDPTVS